MLRRNDATMGEQWNKRAHEAALSVGARLHEGRLHIISMVLIVSGACGAEGCMSMMHEHDA